MEYIIVTFAIGKEGDQYVSECIELGTASCGDTEKSALENVIDATELYLNTLEDLGECKRVLKKKGVSVHTGVAAASGDKIQLKKLPPGSFVHAGVLPVPVQACA